MLVTILTVSFNSAETISRTIESVLNQTYSEIEYIIIDGASKDGTADKARLFQEKFDLKPGFSLKVISEPDNGMYDGLNKGARMAHGEIVGQINADDWYEPDAVQTMVEFYKREHYDVAWGSINILKKSGKMVKHAKLGRLWVSSHFCHPAMFSRREILLQYPYVEKTMFDDFDFATHVYIDGKNVKTIDKVISNFTFGGMSTKKSLRELRRRIRLTYGIYRKYGMSRFYWFYRVAYESLKFILS